MARIFETNVIINATPSELNHAVRLVDLENAIGEHYKRAVRVAVTADIGDVTYDSGALTLTENSPYGGTPYFDNLPVAVGDRVLLAGQPDATQNGIYVVTAVGVETSSPYVLTRATDFDSSSEISPSVKVPVTQGNVHHDKVFTLTNDGPITLDTTELHFEIVIDRVASVKQKNFTITGTGSQTAFTVTHNWGTKLLTVTVREATTGAEIFTDVALPNDNTVQINFALAPVSGKVYNVIILTEVSPV
jgi:hypothetical protein